MKIRIKGNSVRFRLTKSDISLFEKHGWIEEKTEFEKNVFTYRLVTEEGAENLSAQFADGVLTITLPLDQAKLWPRAAIVGFENEMDTGNGKKLFLLVEKDYKCLDNVAEDQTDNYDNPLA